MCEASKDGGLAMDVIRKIIKDMLEALRHLHSAWNQSHTNIKPSKIATELSQRNLWLQMNEYLNSGKSLEPFRMSSQQGTEFDGPKRRRKMIAALKDFQPPEGENESKVLNFKLTGLRHVLVSI